MSRRTGPSCSVCQHPRRAEIDADGRAQAKVAEKYDVSASSLQRHRQHLAAETTQAVKVVKVPPSSVVPSGELEPRKVVLETLHSLRRALAQAEAEDIPRLANAITNAGKQLRALTADQEITEAKIVQSPVFAALLVRFEKALRPYPDAARAMAQALRNP